MKTTESDTPFPLNVFSKVILYIFPHFLSVIVAWGFGLASKFGFSVFEVRVFIRWGFRAMVLGLLGFLGLGLFISNIDRGMTTMPPPQVKSYSA